MHSLPSIIRRLTLVLAPLIIVLIHSVSYPQETSYSASFKQNKESIAVNVLVGQSRVSTLIGPWALLGIQPGGRGGRTGNTKPGAG